MIWDTKVRMSLNLGGQFQATRVTRIKFSYIQLYLNKRMKQVLPFTTEQKSFVFGFSVKLIWPLQLHINV